MTTIQKVQAKVSSWSRVGVRRIGKQPSGVNSCSVAVQDRIADGVGSEPAGRNGRGALIDGDIFKVRNLWRCCRSFW